MQNSHSPQDREVPSSETRLVGDLPDYLENSWRATFRWLKSKSLITGSMESHFQWASKAVNFQQPTGRSFLYLLLKRGQINEDVFLQSARAFQMQLWPFALKAPLPNQTFSEFPQSRKVLQETGAVLVSGFSRLLFTIAHVDPFLAQATHDRLHLVLRESEDAPTPCIHTVWIPLEVLEPLYTAHYEEP